MEAGAALLLLLLALLGPASTLSFYGDSISFMRPQKKSDGTFEVTFYHRQNGRGSCEHQSSFTCDSEVCSSFNESSFLKTDQDDTDQGRWCQSEGQTTAILSTNHTSLTLRGSGCCWLSNADGVTNWTAQAELDLGTRSDLEKLNSCPISATVSSLRVPQNCFAKLRLLAHDPDGDHVKCSFTTNSTVPSNFSLDEAACTLMSTGEVDVGVHVFEIMLQDFATENITLTYADGTSEFRDASGMSPLCTVKLQFSVEVLPPIPNCEAGHVLPIFLSSTPLFDDVLYASVGHEFQLHARAQAHHASIHDFQVSGPVNMSKKFMDQQSGRAKVTLSWTPQPSDLDRIVPVCFTAETNETQSGMRCIVVMVTEATITEGKATVKCSPNKMVVALEKATMPGVDMNYLKLKDQSCSLTSNDTHIIGTMTFRTCGTEIEDDGDFIIFKNEINSFELATEVVVRRRTVKIGFSCQFPKYISISSYYNVHDSDYVFTESSLSSFAYTFEIYQNSNFTDKVEASAYPVEVKLLETFYMGIQTQTEFPNVQLFVESCKGTPDDNPDNAIYYDLVKNGCIQDETFTVYPSSQTSFNFEVQAFKFSGNYDQVYITCSVILCDLNSPFSRCAQGCLSTPSRRRKRWASMETDSRSLVQGPLQFVDPSDPKGAVDDVNSNAVMKQSDTPNEVIPPPVFSYVKPSERSWGIKEILNTNVSTVVFASLFLVTLVSMAVVVRHFTRKRKA